MAAAGRMTESGILRSVHKTAAGLHKAGLMDKATMREFDAVCLTPGVPLAPKEISALRERGQGKMSDSTSTGNAGEHLVMAELLARGFQAFRADRSNPAYDLAVYSGRRHSLIRVKTTTSANLQWTAKSDDSVFLNLKRKGDFVAIVVMRDEKHRVRKADVYLVPSWIVDREIQKCYAFWLCHPGRNGQERKRTTHRGLGLTGSDTSTNIAHGYARKWTRYLEAWDQLR